ncbi:structural maintenance of chromosomes protein 5 isoform X2 [Prorops nasuta]|uniref:structural maintenance of chromosomes protein 5 isoform X2 n=1 Tax=Prorops nasuta TaxID=863751 RepID=UPI0034CEA117
MDHSEKNLNGIITYIYMENFVTYDSCVIKPGRNLNLIIGPNGTDYVKAGCTESKIEIKLKSSAKDTVTITRKFTCDGKTTWYINEQIENIKKIQELVSKYNIQMDNLCQFLPQDKVQDFSKMNAQELLENTERSIGDAKLYEYHLKLKQYRVKHKDLEAKLASKKRLLEIKSEEYHDLQHIVRTIQERKRIKKKIQVLNQKKAWILYDDARKELITAKKDRDVVAEKMRKLDAELKPIVDEISKIKSEMKVLEQVSQNPKNNINKKYCNLQELSEKTQDYRRKCDEHRDELKIKIQQEMKREDEILLMEQKKEKLESDVSLMLQEIGTEESMSQKQDEVSSAIKFHSGEINNLMTQINSLKQQLERNKRKIVESESELQSLNIDAKRLELLRRKSNDSYKAVLWLRQNMDKFSRPVHEPILLHINLKDSRYSKYLERILSFRDLIAFVCESKSDMNLLLRYLRDEQRLQVNAVYSDPAKRISIEPRIPIEQIVNYGFKNYLVSLFEAPDSIMRYLVSMYGLNNIPVGTSEVENNIDHLPSSLRCFFSESNIYSLRISKYSGQKSIQMSQVKGTGILSIMMDHDKIKRIEENIQQLQRGNESIKEQVIELEEKVDLENKELQKYRDLRNKYQQESQQIQALKSQATVILNKIKELKKGKIEIMQIKSDFLKQRKNMHQKELKIIYEYEACLDDILEHITKSDEITLTLELHRQTLIEKDAVASEIQHKLKAVEHSFKSLDEELQPLKRETEKLYKTALESTNNVQPGQKEFRTINAAFAKLPPTIEEINAEINLARNKMFCMGKIINPEEMLQRYENLEEELKLLKEFIENKTNELEEIKKQTDALCEKWITPLEDLVSQINTNFSSHFASMKCAGEVTLTHGENTMDFDQYGLTIRVKFRDIDELQELTRQRQSGGERAVTTAIYMIALQELTRVPFRCVDEINQGMDASNERRVFDLLVNITGKPNSSQYFLLTPKLLPNLIYSKTVTIHCVFNGPFMISHKDFNTEDYCKEITKLQRKENLFFSFLLFLLL